MNFPNDSSPGSSQPDWKTKPKPTTAMAGAFWNPEPTAVVNTRLAEITGDCAERLKFPGTKKSLYAASARPWAASAFAVYEDFHSKAFARASPRCASAPVQQFQTIPP